MWNILANPYNKGIDILTKHKLWLKNIALAVIYQEFTVVITETVRKIDYAGLFSLSCFNWEETTLAYLSSEYHLGYSFFTPYTQESRDSLLRKLVVEAKNDIFYSLVKHYSSSNAVFEEMLSSIDEANEGVSLDNYLAFEYVNEKFTLSDYY